MGKYTIDLSPEVEARLAPLVSGAGLELEGWIYMTLKAAALQTEIREAGEAIRLQARVDGEAAVKAVRDRMIADLE